ncbi:MAG: hypothetical protein ABII06_13855, partial [Pseudomonadota bacterium]
WYSLTIAALTAFSGESTGPSCKTAINFLFPDPSTKKNVLARAEVKAFAFFLWPGETERPWRDPGFFMGRN